MTDPESQNQQHIIDFDALDNEHNIVTSPSKMESPKDDRLLVCEVQKDEEQSQLQIINEEQCQQNMIERSEKLRLERIKNLRSEIKIKRQLSTIQELSDQSINASSPYVDHEAKPRNSIKEDVLFKIIEEQKELKESVVKLERKKSLKRKKKKNNNLNNKIARQLTPIDGYEASFSFTKYYNDKRVDCSWKLLFIYFTMLILINIILNIIETVKYSGSPCKLKGLDNTFIYVNQTLYIFCKVGILSLIYQEFTNTLPTKTKLPLIHTTLFSSIFPVLSMPLYVHDFIECIPRSHVFDLEQSITILSFLDWCLIAIFSIVIILNVCLKITLQRRTWKTLKKILKVFYYLLLLMLHLIQIMMIASQSTTKYLPAMIMENYYFFFSLISMLYLTIYKQCLKQQPFQFNTVEIIDLEKRPIIMEKPMNEVDNTSNNVSAFSLVPINFQRKQD